MHPQPHQHQHQHPHSHPHQHLNPQPQQQHPQQQAQQAQQHSQLPQQLPQPPPPPFPLMLGAPCFGPPPGFPFGALGPAPGPMCQVQPRRKNATRETTMLLKHWLSQHKRNPYPTKNEKVFLAVITCMSLTQVSTWFANARRRLKKENKMTWSPRNRCDDDDDDDDDDADVDDVDDDADVDDVEDDKCQAEAEQIGQYGALPGARNHHTNEANASNHQVKAPQKSAHDQFPQIWRPYA